MPKRGRPRTPRIDPATLPKPVMTLEEAAIYLRIGRHQAYVAAREGALPVRRFGRTMRVLLTDLERPPEPVVDAPPGLALVK